MMRLASISERAQAPSLKPKEVEMIVERRLRVVIPEDHRIVVDIPEDIPTGPAEILLMVEQPEGGEARDVAVSANAKARFESLADELAADPRPFQELSQDERNARLRRVIGIGRDLFSPSEEIARRKEEDIELEERRFGR
jgi:hypothetical protein